MVGPLFDGFTISLVQKQKKLRTLICTPKKEKALLHIPDRHDDSTKEVQNEVTRI